MRSQGLAPWAAFLWGRVGIPSQFPRQLKKLEESSIEPDYVLF
jgi:hypothetical protein